MCDLPPTVDLPPAESRPPAHIDLYAVGLCSDHPIDGMTKRKVVTGLDAEFTYFETHVTVKRPQPFGEARSQQIRSLVLERLHDVERDNVRDLMGHHCFDIFRT